MNEFATRIHIADRLDAIATSQMLARCTAFGQPKIHTPRSVDSMKNANSASIASGAPKISPMKRAYSDQFIPNWNS